MDLVGKHFKLTSHQYSQLNTPKVQQRSNWSVISRKKPWILSWCFCIWDERDDVNMGDDVEDHWRYRVGGTNLVSLHASHLIVTIDRRQSHTPWLVTSIGVRSHLAIGWQLRKHRKTIDSLSYYTSHLMLTVCESQSCLGASRMIAWAYSLLFRLLLILTPPLRQKDNHDEKQ